MRRLDRLIPIAAGLLLTWGFIYTQFSEVSILRSASERLEAIAYSARLRATLPFQHYKKNPVVIIDVDEASLRQVGRWPWPRSTTAKLIENLFANGASVIAFDVLFTQPEGNPAAAIIADIRQHEHDNKQLDAIAPQIINDFDDDAKFAKAIGKGDVVLGYILHDEKLAPEGKLPPPFETIDPKFGATLTLPIAKSYTGIWPELVSKGHYYTGFLNATRDSDGAVRRAPLVMRYANELHPSLSLETAKIFLLAEKTKIVTDQIGGLNQVEGVKLDNAFIPTDVTGKVLVPFRGGEKTFPYISAIDVLNNKIPVDIHGKIALVGTSALGLSDLQATPVGNAYPGVEVHANVISAIINNELPYEPAWAPGANIALLVGFGVVLSILFSFSNPFVMFVCTFLALVGHIGFNAYEWLFNGLSLEIMPPILLIIILVIINTIYWFIFEKRREKQITAMFGQYVSKDVVAEMSRDPGHYTFEGKSCDMTVLFADIRSFTSISEKLTAAELKDLLNKYFEPMTEIIFNQEGTIDKYVGDMIMAFWGAPKPVEQQADKAVAAAMAMIAKTAELKQQFAELGLPEVRIGVGLNSGTMNVGDMGSKYRRSYTVLGDEVNLGSRIESSTKFYGVDILIGENTYKQLKDIVCREIDLVKVVGKDKAVGVYEPLVKLAEMTPEIQQRLTLHQEAMQRYFAKDFAAAEGKFQMLQQMEPNDKVPGLFLERIKYLKENPPPADWDGSFTRTEK